MEFTSERRVGASRNGALITSEAELGFPGTPRELAYLMEEYHDWKRRLVDETSYAIPRYNMMNNYERLASWKMLHNFYHVPVGSKNYFVVFKPFNKTKDEELDGLKHVRAYLKNKKVKIDAVIITREILATRVHYNMLIQSTFDFMTLHDKQTSKYRMFVTEVKGTIRDVMACHEYIIKESKIRYFHTRSWDSRSYTDRVDLFCMTGRDVYHNDLA